MTARVPRPPLRTTVIMDYQNVHLTGHEVFGKPKHLEKHETLIDPLLYAQQPLRGAQETNQASEPWRRP
jgi:hypothetical protein